jgi:hypothetical protein
MAIATNQPQMIPNPLLSLPLKIKFSAFFSPLPLLPAPLLAEMRGNRTGFGMSGFAIADENSGNFPYPLFLK